MKEVKMVRRKTIAVLIVIIVIVAIVIFTGCVEVVLMPHEVVKDFASHHKNGKMDKCYSLMSIEYKNLTDKNEFKDKIKQCNDYVLIEVKSEEIDGDMASVEIRYMKRSIWGDVGLSYLLERVEGKSKTVNLIKEGDKWKLTELYCELKSE
jgi:hypothetical protein